MKTNSKLVRILLGIYGTMIAAGLFFTVFLPVETAAQAVNLEFWVYSTYVGKALESQLQQLEQQYNT